MYVTFQIPPPKIPTCLQIFQLPNIKHFFKQHTVKQRKKVTAETMESSGKTVINVFLEVCDKHSAATCFEYWNGKTTSTLTYVDFLSKVKVLAKAIWQSRASKQKDSLPSPKAPFCVGVCVSEGFAFVLTIVSVLFTGCAIVPININDPDDKIKSICNDAKPFLLVCFQQDKERLITASGVKRTLVISTNNKFDVEVDIPIDSCEDSTIELPIPNEDYLSHIYFTSGTTGRPKGVACRHKALSSFCRAKNDAHGFCQGHKCFVASSISFDPSLGDICATLSIGGTVCLAPRKLILTNLAKCLEITKSTHITATPSLWGSIGSDQVLPKTLKIVALGGEVCPIGMVQRYANVPGLTFLNTYGVTECCVYQSIYNFSTATSSTTPHNTHIIGTPLSKDIIFLVCDPSKQGSLEQVPMTKIQNDENHEHIADTDNNDEENENSIANTITITSSCKGELVIGGAQVGIGYVRQKDLTASKFLVHNEHGMMYRTGDIVERQWLIQDDEVCERYVFVGRLDNQIKLRGVRIELGEVESRLLSSSVGVIKSSVVSVIDDSLIAFVQPCNPIPTTAKTLIKDCLRLFSEALPLTMVPNKFVLVNDFPMGSTGKVDRERLQEIMEEEEENYCYDNEPLTDTEEMVAAIWAAELGIPLHPQVARKTAHFVELGGDSLTALRVGRRLALLDTKNKSFILYDGEVPELNERPKDPFGALDEKYAPFTLLKRPRLEDYCAYLDNENDTTTSTPECIPSSLLYRAVTANALTPELMSLLLERNANIDGIPEIIECCSEPEYYGQKRCPLIGAVSNGPDFSNTVKLLLNANADINKYETQGITAIHLAVQFSNFEVVQILLSFKAELDSRDFNKQTVLHHAARAGAVEMLRDLLPLWQSFQEELGNIDPKVSVFDVADRYNRSPLHWAVLTGHRNAVQMLIDHGASVKPNFGKDVETPLEMADRYFFKNNI